MNLIPPKGEICDDRTKDGEISKEGHRKRIKEAVRENGLMNKYEHSVLEFLLFYCIPRKDTKNISYELINKFGNLYGVFNAPHELLEQTNGIAHDSSTFLNALGEICERYSDESEKRYKIGDVNDIMRFMRRIVVPNVEACYVINLDSENEIVSVEKVLEGVDNALDIPLKLIFRTVMTANARRAIVMHNHPSSQMQPSEEDISHSFIMNAYFEEMKIELVDHLIVYEKYVYSVKSNNMIKHNWRMR